MKILVDELPKTPKECLFVGAKFDMPYGEQGYDCTLSQGRTCPGVEKCKKLEVRIERPYFSNCC